jgi:glycosyltransferase involved in cell wall biosynthesis
MVVIEAMACGTPVVALRAGSVPEVVVDGVTGLIRDEPDELVGALADVRGIDPAACRAHVAEHFGLDGLSAGYEAAYLRALENTGPRRDRGDALVTLRCDYAAPDLALDR